MGTDKADHVFALVGSRPPRRRLIPASREKVACVAVGEALEIVLMLGLDLPERSRWLHLSDDASRPKPRGVDVGDGLFGHAALFVGEAEGAVEVAVPLDDGIAPRHYTPMSRYVLARAGL